MIEFKLPDGWAREALQSGQVLITTPIKRYMATIDFNGRGFRSGLVQSGRFEGDKLTRKGLVRKQYKGRGWQQKLVDDAVAWLRAV
jgi:hypothetical protein